MEAIDESTVVLLSGVGTAEEWTFELRADERDAVAAVQEYCGGHDLPVIPVDPDPGTTGARARVGPHRGTP